MSRAIQHQIPEYLVRRQSAKRSERLVQIVALSGALACLAAASALTGPVDTIRKNKQLTLDPEDTHGLPPDISLITKTGTFRALAIDVLFMRLERLKQDNKWYELNKLSSAICKLAPRFPSVWKYAAWNMAYNISVTQYSPSGRWYWVRKGVELLRNQGLRYNEKSIGLYLELSWIFWHKIGGYLDDHHLTYKKELAVEMERVLGPPPVVLTEQDVVRHFARIAIAPKRLDDLLAQDHEAVDFVAKLADVGLTPDEDLLGFVARYLRSELQVEDVLKDVPADAERTMHEARVELLSDPDSAPVRDRLLACLRNGVLRDKFNMDPEWMHQLMEDFGPLDWRLPFTHAIYWSTRGDMITKGQLILDENDSMNTVRYIFFGLARMIDQGRLVLEPDFEDPKRSYLDMLPDTRFIKHMHETYLRLGKEQFGDDPRFIEGTAGPNYRAGHVTFLEDGIHRLYTEGGPEGMKLARRYYAYLREYNPDKVTHKVQDRYLQPLERFVMREFWDELTSSKRATAIIGVWILRSLKNLSLGEVDQSIAAMERAKQGWMYYMEDKRFEPGQLSRRGLRPLIDMRANALAQFMQGQSIHVLHKARLWQRLDKTTRQMAYDRLAPYFRRVCQGHRPPLDPVKAFPEPPGMEEFRRSRPEGFGPDPSIDHGEKG